MFSCFRPHRVHIPFRPSASSISCKTRQLSSSRVRQQEDGAEANADGAGEADATAAEAEADGGPITSKLYEAWIQIEGPKWKRPDPLGPKWLGDSVPFPLNPTFRPPTPVSDALRTTIYTSYLANPTLNDPHALSTRYGISIKRVEAIIRLKELEDQWKKSKPLQTGFLKGMERMLGLNPGGRRTNISDEVSSPARAEVNEADELSRRLSGEDRERRRGISRTFFEPADEGEEAVVPRLLNEQREKAHAARAQRPDHPTVVVQPDPSKPPYKFVDVGSRWSEPADMERRQKESIRRKAIKSGKRAAASSS